MGVMKFTKVALKNLFSKPATLMYPIQKREFYERYRGQIRIEIDKCIFCGICSKKCPTYAITVIRGDKSWEIDRLKCIQCNCCVECCPKKCLNMLNKYTEPTEGEKKDRVVQEIK